MDLFRVIVQRSKNLPEYRLCVMDNSLQRWAKLNLSECDSLSLHGNVMISIRGGKKATF